MADAHAAEERLTAVGLSPGVAVGPVYIHQDLLLRDHDQYAIDAAELSSEWSRLATAIETVVRDLEALTVRMAEEVDAEIAGILAAQQAMLDDPALHEELEKTLHDEKINAEQVVRQVFRRFERQLEESENLALHSRGDDVADLARRVLRCLAGIRAHAIEETPEGSVLGAQKLLPSDTVYLPRNRIAGMILGQAGPTSHAAILTRELGIPAVAGVEDVCNRLTAGELAIVDGTRGTVILRPDEDTRQAALERRDRLEAELARARERAALPAKTGSGVTVPVLANIGGVEDSHLAHREGADGIGLFRLETYFMQQEALPDTDALGRMLKQALQPFAGATATVRLLDIGADKALPYLDLPAEANPMLGRRGIRLLLAYPELLHTQLDALLHTARDMPVRILIPMVTKAEEVVAVREHLEARGAARGLEALPALGAMVETPAAALCAEGLARESDFLSLGTNDLTQYTMAAGRENPHVDVYYDDRHAAVQALVAQTTAAGKQAGIPVEVCGELAANAQALPALLAAGVNALSVAPLQVALVKERVRSCGPHQAPEDDG